MRSASNSIIRRIRAKQRGWVFTPKNFIDLAPRNNIDITLYRLLKKGTIRKLARGIYDFPVKHLKLGDLAASPDSIANAMSSKTNASINPSGANLANQLGLDTQVPAKPHYLTSGKSTQKKIANYSMIFSHSRFLNNIQLNTNTTKMINALYHMGRNNITPDTINKCKNILSNKDKSQLKKNLAKLPDWMVPFILKIMEK